MTGLKSDSWLVAGLGLLDRSLICLTYSIHQALRSFWLSKLFVRAMILKNKDVLKTRAKRSPNLVIQSFPVKPNKGSFSFLW